MTSELRPPGDAQMPEPDYGRVRPWTLILILPGSLLPIIAISIAIPKQARGSRSLWDLYATLALLGGWSWIQIRRAHGGIHDLVGRDNPRPSEWAQILLALPAIGLAVGLSWLTYFPLKLLGLDVDLERMNLLNRFETLGSAGRVMEILAIVVLGPIVEECVFRGLLLRAWSRRLGLSKGLLYTSLLFGVGHDNPLGISVVGLVLAILLVTTRSLLIPIGCHALGNAIAVLWWHTHWLRNVAWTDLKGGLAAIPLALISALILIAWFRTGPRERLRQVMTQWPQPGTTA